MPAGPEPIPAAIRVRVEQEGVAPLELSFAAPFRVGRGTDCEVQIDTDVVSRTHLETSFRDGRWWVRDLDSTNGTYVDGSRITELCVEGQTCLQLARDGPVLRLTVGDGDGRAEPGATLRSAPPDPPPVDDYVRHYLDPTDAAEPAGEHTMMIRRAFATVQQHQRRRHLRLAAAGVGVILLLGGFAAFQRWRLERQDASRKELAHKLRQLKDSASAVFDEMKTLELQIAQLRSVVQAKGQAELSDQLLQLEQTRRRMSSRYDGYVEQSGTYRALNVDERVIYRVARVFNESEFGMPAGFVTSVKQTIRDYWQTPAGRERFLRAVEMAERKGYARSIVETMHRYGLPAQFFYLALQESNFNVNAVGPPTRWGRAKGMWQFIAPTALLYDLDPGAYPDKVMVDPHDERHDFVKSTEAAARYLQSIYSTLAQASGLLAMASYNWGEHRVVDKLEDLPGPQAIPKAALDGIPENPSARNYWRFLGEYANRMPTETKDYVLKIFSAAVIGEDPRLFGFDSDNPLDAHMDQLGQGDAT
jgi:soluble lytic murein transglycosylase-like protein